MITQEELSGYLDGELSAKDSRKVEAAAASDPMLRARLEGLRKLDGSVRAAFDTLLEARGPDPLEAMIRSRIAEPQSSHAGDNVVAFAPRRMAARNWQWPSAIAATLVAGVLFGQVVHLGSDERGDWVNPANGAAPQAGKVLAAALSTTPSGTAFDLGKGRQGVARLTFVSTGGELCRQFEINDGRAQSGVLACRSGEGAWRLTAVAPLHASGAAGGFSTAAGPGDDPVSAMADKLIAGAPMDAAQEAAALRARR